MSWASDIHLVLAPAVCVAVGGYILTVRRHLLLLLLWFLIPAVWRAVSALYIDQFGPVYADELLRTIGPGQSAGLLLWHYGVALLVFAWVLRASVLVGAPTPAAGAVLGAREGRRLFDLAFYAALAFIVGLYLDMALRRQVPLLAGIERYDYTALYGGPLHRILIRWGDLFAAILGFLFVVARTARGEVDHRFLWLLGAACGYMFLAGHRYSAFFRLSVMFALPTAVLALPSCSPRGPAARMTRDASRRVRSWGAVVVALIVALAITGVSWSYFVVRVTEEIPLAKLKARVLVQQAQLWVLTFERVIEHGRYVPERAAEFLFVNPPYPDRNTTIGYLMWRALGGDAHRLLAQGQQYTGGFPEIFVELFGGLGSLVATLGLSVVTGLLVRIAILSVAEAKPLTFLCAAYLVHGMAVVYWGGMLNLFLMWTYWVKCAGLAGAWAIETLAPARGVQLVPWAPADGLAGPTEEPIPEGALRRS